MPWGTRLAHEPQRLWVRRALFQIHLWTGVGVGLYMLAISITGSAIVFRRELAKAIDPGRASRSSGRRLTQDELTAAVRKVYPRSPLIRIWDTNDPTAAVEVWLARQYGRREQLFDPYTGKDLGDTVPYQPRLVGWLVDFHDDLLGGRTGRLVNGAGAVCLTVLSLTGLVIWWPGMARWRRSLSIRLDASWRRLIWDFHSAVGFWMFLFVLMWGLSGIYLAFPDPFSRLVDVLQPVDASSTEVRFGDEALAWLARIHFGRAWGPWIKALWVVLGLTPAVLFITGAIMWWNRVLRRERREEQPFPASSIARLQ